MSHGGGVRAIAGGTDPEAVVRAIAVLADRLAGRGPVIAPVAASEPRPGHALTPPVAPPDADVLLATSGSSGRPRLVALDAAALLASARATHAALGGPGRWLLALGIHHVAGWQVLVRSAVAGEAPVVLDTTAGFRARDLPAAVAGLGSGHRRYTALVPTQLVRALLDPRATAALAGLDAVLVGGAALPDDVRERARAAGVRVITTYGMTETGGGCVYDGRPLEGVAVSLDDDSRLVIAGPTLALGYVGPGGRLVPGEADDGARFLTSGGARRLRTADLGHVAADGLVGVLGRADDVIVTGGVKVHPAPVERVLAHDPGVGESVVVGLPDPEWGSAVVAVVVPTLASAPPDLVALRARVSHELGAASAPRALAVVEALPVRGPGKVDRAAAARLAAGILARP